MTDPENGPVTTSVLEACQNVPARFLIELARWKGALLDELRTGLQLSGGRSPALRRTISQFLEETIGPDPRWIKPTPKNLGSLLAVLDAYSMQQQIRYGFGADHAVRHSVMTFCPDAFTEIQKARWRAVRDFCIATWPTPGDN